MEKADIDQSVAVVIAGRKVLRCDEVITEGGIIGTVVHMAEDRVTIKSGETRIVVARPKIARRLAGDSPASGTA